MAFTELCVSGAARRLEGPLLFLERTVRVGLNSAVEVIGPDGVARVGRVALIDDERMVVEVLESTSGLGLGDTRVRVRNEPLTFGVGPGMLGRIFNSIGMPVDGGPPIPAREYLPVSGWSINPAARALPRDFIETGISTIDLMNSLVRGQKLPLFSGGGLPHDRMATEIAQRARLLGGEVGREAHRRDETTGHANHRNLGSTTEQERRRYHDAEPEVHEPEHPPEITGEDRLDSVGLGRDCCGQAGRVLGPLEDQQ